jgi:hypothetical protein
LKENAGTWRMAYREAIGNDIDIRIEKGIVEQNYPVIITAEKDKAQFTIKGGNGYVPLTIKRLSTYKVPALYIKDNGSWKKIDQSYNGNDFWQTDFDQSSGTWEFSYNINMDSDEDRHAEREFKFEIVKNK